MVPCIGATIGFEHTMYNINESTTSGQVCMSIMDQKLVVRNNVVVMIESIDKTAAGESIDKTAAGESIDKAAPGDSITVGSDCLHKNCLL